MKSPIRAGSAILVLALFALAGCGQGTATPNEVSMAEADFSVTSVTISVGRAVHFTDPAGVGATHILCLGSEGNCDTTASGPEELEGNGFTINAGDAPRDVVFSTAGTYKITCSLHPNMNLTVTVR